MKRERQCLDSRGKRTHGYMKDGLSRAGRTRDYYIMFGIFFFKQKTAYEMLRSLVGSEMCIRDSSIPSLMGTPFGRRNR